MPLSFIKDLKSKELAPLKLLLFLQAAGDMALYPFFTLHMKYLGITVTEIGIQFAVTPLATLIATPLVGLLADKIGNFRVMLSISLLVCAALSQCLVFVPPVAYLHTEVPYEHRADVACDTTGPGLLVKLPNNFTYLVDHLYTNPDNSSDESKIKILNGTYYLSDCDWTCATDSKTPSGPFLCFRGEKGSEECLESNKVKKAFQVWLTNTQFNTDPEATYFNSPKSYLVKKANYESVLCRPSPNSELAYFDGSCKAQCAIHLDEKDAPHKIIDQDSRSTTFWMYMIVRILLIVTIATEMSLFKAAILTLVDKCDTEYGFQRVWATAAACIVPLITGVIMDHLRDGDIEDYRPCFYIYGAMKVTMAIIILFIPLAAKTPTLEVWKNVLKLVRNPEVCVLLIYCTFVGSCWGFLETFLFWFMEGLGASKLLMGLTFTIGSLCGIPTSIFSGAIERRMGHVGIISLGILAYAVRFVGYSFVYIPYQALFFETLECLTMSLMLITLTTYANKLASAELVATMQATWAALHFAVGRALGSVVGGFMIDGVGSETTYRLYAAKCLFMGILYLILHHCWLKNRVKKTEGEEPEKGKIKKDENSQEMVMTEKPEKYTPIAETNKTELKEIADKQELPVNGNNNLKSDNRKDVDNSEKNKGEDNKAFDKETGTNIDGEIAKTSLDKQEDKNNEITTYSELNSQLQREKINSKNEIDEK